MLQQRRPSALCSHEGTLEAEAFNAKVYKSVRELHGCREASPARHIDVSAIPSYTPPVLTRERQRMTLKELETWHRREAEGRSAQATDRRTAYDALAVKGAKDSRDRARWHLVAADLLASIGDHGSRQVEEAHRAV